VCVCVFVCVCCHTSLAKYAIVGFATSLYNLVELKEGEDMKFPNAEFLPFT
jgi:hypothetical protein